MHYIAALLSSPGVDMHSLDLDGAGDEAAAVTGAEAARENPGAP